MSDTRPPKPEIEWDWYSVCSRHSEYNIDCDLCNKGHWVSKLESEFSNWLWSYSKRIWRKWANRTDSTNRKRLEELFPGLRSR